MKARAAALGALFDEVVALYHRLTADAAAIHGAGARSGPRRTVLAALARSGPQTVAHMARARAQSRQRFQPLVNSLMADGLVEAQPNPVHARSPLIALTAQGRRAVNQMMQTEEGLRTALRPTASPASITRAAAIVRDVRLTLVRQLPPLLRARKRRPKKPA